jgi:hypothetical protein
MSLFSARASIMSKNPQGFVDGDRPSQCVASQGNLARPIGWTTDARLFLAPA